MTLTEQIKTQMTAHCLMRGQPLSSVLFIDASPEVFTLLVKEGGLSAKGAVLPHLFLPSVEMAIFQEPGLGNLNIRLITLDGLDNETLIELEHPIS
jgi:hypothetical protein